MYDEIWPCTLKPQACPHMVCDLNEAKNVDEVAYYQVSDASLLVLILIDGKLCTYVGVGFYQNEIDLTLQTEI